MYMFRFSLLLFFLICTYQVHSQSCSISGTDGNGNAYAINLDLEVLNIITNNCSSAGFNYNLEIEYDLIISGDIFGITAEFNCGHGNLQFQIPDISGNNTGTTTTYTNPYWAGADCTTVENSDLMCGDVTLTININGGTVSETCAISILPIELNYFVAEQLPNNQVQLEWQTLSETNNNYFTIEYSYNGLDWHVLDQIEGAGTTQQAQVYSYTHTNPNGNHIYYRLKQTDFNGTSEVSDIIEVTLNQSIKLLSFPNPVSTTGIIEYPGNKELKIQAIYDVYGRKTSLYAEQRAPNQIELDFSSVSPGIYYIVTNLGTTKFVKSR